MIETIERKLCDVCKKEVESFAGSLNLDYSDSDYTGCGYPARLSVKKSALTVVGNWIRLLGKYTRRYQNDR